ncbi:adenylate/guanylate cyclase domain-containing protein [bacterium]|nr:adenylate/guanylate cyclase domain-containing protein [bacterium]
MNNNKQYLFIILFAVLLLLFSLCLNFSASTIKKLEDKNYKVQYEMLLKNSANSITVSDIETTPEVFNETPVLKNISPLYIMIMVAFFCLIIAYCAIYIEPFLQGFMAGFAGLIAYPVFCFYLSSAYGIYVKVVLPLYFMGLMFLVAILLRWGIYSNKKQVAYKILGKITTEKQINAFLKNKKAFEPKIQTATILFYNVKNIKKLCEKYEETAVISSLNYVYSVVIHAIQRNNGVVDKFSGNNITAYWTDYNSAYLAVKTALDIQEKLGIIADRQPHIDIKGGIHTGELLFGLVGTESVVNYTPIGDGINFAQRLESACTFYDVPVLMSKSTYEIVKDKVEAVKIGNISVKSKNLQIEIFEPKGLLEDD